LDTKYTFATNKFETLRMATKLSFRESLTAGLYAGVLSAVINAILFFVFHSMGIITDDIMVQPNQPLTVVPVLISSILPLVIGSIIFFLLERFTNNGYKIFAVIAIVFAIVSMAGPFNAIPNVTTGYALALCAMHIAPVFFILYFISRLKK